VQFELTVTATGVVTDSDGNVVSQEPVTTTVVVDEQQAAAILAANERNQG